jgi:soluble lytic murein transglycosylase
MLYGSEHEAAHARREAAGRPIRSRWPRRALRPTAKAPTPRALLDAVPRELHGDPGYVFSKIQLLRREEKFAEAAQLMLSAPKDPAGCTISTNGGSSGGCCRARCSTSASIAPPI